MSLVVDNLTKVFGQQKAVDGLSFEVEKGEVLGFLGPNGAGKSTTMKIISCYLAATDGHVTVCGHDVATDPLAARQHIGYLPEHNPLYLDMYVKEYLTFVAGLHSIKNKSARIGEVMTLTGLNKEGHKKIGALSKGYRQRVGLAQAIIHDPDILILDEPTSGLDMNQLVDIRKLISDLGKEKIVILSTHIMQEVEALCDRVIIINNGQLVADDPIYDLPSRIKGGDKISVTLTHPAPSIAVLEQIDGVSEVTVDGPSLVINATHDVRPAVFAAVVAQGWTMIEMTRQSIDVEHIFQQLTKQEQDV